jgi:hypothetical protein
MSAPMLSEPTADEQPPQPSGHTLPSIDISAEAAEEEWVQRAAKPEPEPSRATRGGGGGGLRENP